MVFSSFATCLQGGSDFILSKGGEGEQGQKCQMAHKV